VSRQRGRGNKGSKSASPKTPELEAGAEGDVAPGVEGDAAAESTATESTATEAVPVEEGEAASELDEASAEPDTEGALDEHADPEDIVPGEDDAGGPGLEKTTATPASGHLKSIVESLIFVADKPMTAKQLARLARSRTVDVEEILIGLMADYRGRGIELVEVAGGVQFRSSASSAPFVRELVGKKPVRLSRAQVETLAILAYRQPMTRPELEDIRGVDCGSALKVLLEKNLLRILGRKDEAGRPLLYGTTPHFLEFFGLPSLADLPTLRELGELTDESKALFQRRLGENIETIGDIAIDEHHYTDDEIEALERQARGGPVQEELPIDGEDEAPAPSDSEDDE
jgi:segregation and condensation protein B